MNNSELAIITRRLLGEHPGCVKLWQIIKDNPGISGCRAMHLAGRNSKYLEALSAWRDLIVLLRNGEIRTDHQGDHNQSWHFWVT